MITFKTRNFEIYLNVSRKSLYLFKIIFHRSKVYPLMEVSVILFYTSFWMGISKKVIRKRRGREMTIEKCSNYPLIHTMRFTATGKYAKQRKNKGGRFPEHPKDITTKKYVAEFERANHLKPIITIKT